MSEEQAIEFQLGLFSFLKVLTYVIAAGVAVYTAAWYVAEPRAEGWIEKQLTPIQGELTEVRLAIAKLTSAVNDIQPPDVVEFQGVGVPLGRGPYLAGGFVGIVYQVKRNNPCPTTVQARFLSAETGQLLSQYTYEVPATRAAVSLGFQPFPIGVDLPKDMRDGRYIYAAELEPDRSICPGQRNISPPLSLPFEVKSAR